MAAAANDPGAASGLLAPPSCGVPSGTPRRSSLRLPLSLPGSFTSLAMVTRTDSYGQVTTISDPIRENGGWSGLGAGSPGRRRPQFVHSTLVHAGVPSSIAPTQSTSVGTPPVVSVYTLLLPHIVCRDPVPM